MTYTLEKERVGSQYQKKAERLLEFDIYTDRVQKFQKKLTDAICAMPQSCINAMKIQSGFIHPPSSLIGRSVFCVVCPIILGFFNYRATVSQWYRGKDFYRGK